MWAHILNESRHHTDIRIAITIKTVYEKYIYLTSIRRVNKKPFTNSQISLNKYFNQDTLTNWKTKIKIPWVKDTRDQWDSEK